MTPSRLSAAARRRSLGVVIALLVVVGGLLLALWILRATLRWVRYDQAARIVEHWRQNGIT
jgi:hypothetical protein